MKTTTLTCYALFFLAAAGIIVMGCKNSNGNSKENMKVDSALVSQKDPSIPGNFSTQTTLYFDSAVIPVFLKQYPLLQKYTHDLEAFYRARNYAYAWYDNQGLIEQAANLYNRIQNIKEEGLPDKIPYKQEFTVLMENNGMDSTGQPSNFTELMITAQYFFYADKVWTGIDEKQSRANEWLLPRKKLPYDTLLDSLISGKDILTEAPVYRQYELLKAQLKKYRDIAAAGGLPRIPSPKKSYKTGDSTEAIAAIRKLLFITGDLAENNNSMVFDAGLESGVKAFQYRHGLTTDGVIGPAMIAEMNVPVQDRIRTIIVNMERSRWVPVRLTNNYLVVNIPEFRLHVFENDTPAWSMKVVVGKPAHKTAIFNGEIKYVVFSPYWNVPTSILNNEIKPAIRRNKNYLARHNMEWNGNSVRQKPGPDNALGLVKFLFPNSHSIYLHDTPSKSLFGESTRAFSHGCIRLAEAQKLAEYLLRNDPDWTNEKIDTAMHAGVEKYVTLKEPIPVFIAYFTAWVDKNGNLNLRKDVYGRDSRIAEMILEVPPA